MKYNVCDFLLHEIAFYKDSIRPCCSFSIEGDITPFVNDYNGDINGFINYLAKRDSFINIFNSGNLPVCFKNCTTYKPSMSDNISFKLNCIIISNYTKCSCNCIYCEQASYGQNVDYKKWLNNRNSYDIKPLLFYLRDKNYIENNCRFLICGGECSEYPNGELEWLIYFAKICNGNLLILSSGIIYSIAIEQALVTSDTILKISLDCGSKETFEKIKRVKAFNIVVENIKKYISVIPKNHSSSVHLKYIIIPGINDNIQEIDKFISICSYVNCNHIVLDVEHQWISKNKGIREKEEKISKLLNYFFKFFNRENLFISMEGVEEDWLWSLVELKYNYKIGEKNEI